MSTRSDPSIVAGQYARRRRGGRSRGKEPALKRLFISLVGLLAAAAVVAAPTASAPQQTPKRGGTVVFGPVAELSCLNPFRDCRVLGPQFNWIVDKVLPGAFALARDSTLRPRLVSAVTFTRTDPFTLTYAIRPEAHWSDGVQVTARDFLYTHLAIRHVLPGRPTSHVRPQRPQGRRKDGQGRPTVALRGVAPPFLADPAAARARGGGSHADLDRRHREPEDRQTDRLRAVPRRKLDSWKAAHTGAQPEVLGPARGVSRPLDRPLLRGRVRGPASRRGARGPANGGRRRRVCPRHRHRPGSRADTRHDRAASSLERL